MKKGLFKKITMQAFLCAFCVVMAMLICASMLLTLLPTDEEGPSVQANADGNKDDGNNRPKADKRVAFTFDDGPQAPAEDLENGYYPYTTYILDKLDSLDMKATFFVLGERAKSYPNAIYRALTLGCEIGSHTYDHSIKFNESTTDAEILEVLNKASDAIVISGAPAPKLFRPVGGAVSSHQLEVIASAGYITVGWSVDSKDWEGKPTTGDKLSDDPERNAKYEAFVNEKVEAMYASIKDGDIVLMHDISMSSVDIFIRLADKLVESGFELVTVSEILADTLAEDGAKPVMYISDKRYLNSMN